MKGYIYSRTAGSLYLPFRWILLTTLLLLSTATARAATIYVDSSATCPGNGASWATAFCDVQPALAAALPGDEIWIATGTYFPTSTLDRTISFDLPDSVGIYGGFDGTESQRNQRNWMTQPSILSGDLGMPGNNMDNTHHVVNSANTSNQCILDGVVIFGGMAVGAPSNLGAGIVCSNSTMQLLNCTVTRCRAGGGFGAGLGGGLYCDNASPEVRLCTFSFNTCTTLFGGGGGAIGNGGTGSPVIFGCYFYANNGTIGGAVTYGSGVTAIIDSCVFDSNSANNAAAVSIGWGDDIVIRRCRFKDNYETAGGGGNIGVVNGTCQVDECVFERVNQTTGTVAGFAMSNGGDLDVINSTFRNLINQGGAAVLHANQNSLFTMDNCHIVECNSLGGPGALSIAPHSVVNSEVTNTSFRGNTSQYGAAIAYGAYGTHLLENCEFVNNTATGVAIGGGAVASNNTPNLQVRSCSFGGNTSAFGGSGASFLGNGGDTTTVKNCIFWDDTTGHGVEIATNAGVLFSITYSDIKGGFTGMGNLDVDPLFLNPNGPDWTRATEDDHLRLNPCSPVIDMGDNVGVLFPNDLDGNARIFNGTIDMGVYETQGAVCPVNALALGNDTALCAGDSIVLDADSGFVSYTWSTGDSSQTITVGMAGTYWVEVMDTNGLVGNDTIVVNLLARPTVAIAPDTSWLCPGDSVQLDGTDPSIASYLWNTGETSSTIFAGPPGTYWLVGTGVNSCTDSAFAEVINFPTPVTSLGPDTAYCAGDTFQLDGGAGFAAYLWSGGFSGRYLDVVQAGTYILQATDSNTCIVLDTVDIAEEALPSLSLGGDVSICEGESIIFDAGPGYAAYSWSTGATTQSIMVNVAGTYFVELTSALGCIGNSDMSTVTLDPLPTPVIELAASGTDLTTTQPFTTYQWYLDGSPISGATARSTALTGAGSYHVEVTNSFGCSGTSALFVYTATLVIPEGFSPNSDNLNDNFVISNLDRYPDNEIVIFNRWGGEVFRETGYKNNWNGLGKGDKPLPDGTYYYIVDLKDGTEPRNGYVIISR